MQISLDWQKSSASLFPTTVFFSATHFKQCKSGFLLLNRCKKGNLFITKKVSTFLEIIHISNLRAISTIERNEIG